MATIARSRIHVTRSGAPDESRPFKAHGHAEMHKLGEGMAMRGVFEPGWKWSQDIGPIAGTKSCQASHLGYIVSGRMRIRMDDGQEEEVGPGDFMRIDPGHDAWVVGDEACVVIDFGGYRDYARASTTPAQPRKGGERPSVS